MTDLIREHLASLVSTGVCQHCGHEIEAMPSEGHQWSWHHAAPLRRFCEVASPKPLDLRSLDPKVRAALLEALHPEPQELGMRAMPVPAVTMTIEYGWSYLQTLWANLCVGESLWAWPSPEPKDAP